MSLLRIVDIGAVTIFPSANITGTTGDNITLTCLAIITEDPPSEDVSFEWFFGPNNLSLFSDHNVTISSVSKSNDTYNSTLQFSPLLLSHAGVYTCRLWNYSNHAASASITVFSKHTNTVTLRLPVSFLCNRCNCWS